MRTGAVETERGKRLSGGASGSCEVAVALVVAASSHSLPIHRHTDALNQPKPFMELIDMNSSSQNSRPDETASSDLSSRQKPSAGRPEGKKQTGTSATESRRPSEAAPPHPETDEDEEILVREPDGRYRIIGRRPRNPK